VPTVVTMQRRTRQRAYFALMGTALVLILLAWNLVRLWSVPAAVVMSVVASLLPPEAVIVVNAGAMEQAGPREESERDRRDDRDDRA